ncbi:MAG: Stp1/IreP family PP2C-type Ser/Thr phosphatase [Deltaproteobacteria bacterium]|nr:Stp1/IreP family PP2C-type Ser/Thr phosphatase [Deltaproteobacteria bacterium]
MQRDSIHFFAATDVGRQRDHNEDNFLVDKKLNLFIVADGMGGHAAGEVASGLAVRTVRDVVAKNRDLIQDFRSGEKGVTRRDVLNLLEHAVQAACAAIHDVAEKDPEKRGMGTTLSCLLVVGSRGFIAHVGDCRIYLYRQAMVHQLTEDHSLINELIKRGKLKKEEAYDSPYKNAVTRAVGVYASVEVDTIDFDVLAGDEFLLASDGLHGYLREGELPTMLAQIEPKAASETLIKLANDRGGKDNITTVIVKLEESEGELSEKLKSEVNLKIEVLQKMPLFRYLSYKELVRVMNLTDVVERAGGEAIIREGEQGEEMYVVLSGRVRVHKGDADIASLEMGEHFGEMALVDQTPRSASVSAVSDSKLLKVGRKDFFSIIRNEHDLAVKLLWSFLQVLTERLRASTRELGEAREALRMEDLTHEIFAEFDDAYSVEEEPRVEKTIT